MEKKTTPAKRVDKNKKNGTPHSAKTRTRKIASSGDGGPRCLIENTDYSNALEYAHIVPQSTKDPVLLDSLECAWDMGRGTLNIHTRYNLCILGAKFHSLFDKNNWLLIPDEATMSLFRPGYTLPQFTEKEYNYIFVPLRRMESVPIHQQVTTTSPISPTSFRTIVHPFDNLPMIRSHLRPHFVVYNAGMKLIDIKDYEIQYPRLVRPFRAISVLYSLWTAPASETFLAQPIAPSAPTEEEESDACAQSIPGSEQSTQTAPGRFSSASKKRSREADNNHMELNDETPTKKSRSVMSGGVMDIAQLAYNVGGSS